MILRLLLSVDENSYRTIATHVVGCDGYSCSSGCQLLVLRQSNAGSVHGITHYALCSLAVWPRHVARTSGPVDRVLYPLHFRTLGLHGRGYVDDLIMAYKVVCHGSCVVLALLRGMQQLLASSTVLEKGGTRFF